MYYRYISIATDASNMAMTKEEFVIRHRAAALKYARANKVEIAKKVYDKYYANREVQLARRRELRAMKKAAALAALVIAPLD